MKRSEPLEILLGAAQAGVDEILRKRRQIDRAVAKGDRYVGHQAIVTGTDTRSQRAILNYIHTRNPETYFITEEAKLAGTKIRAGLHSHILTPQNYLAHHKDDTTIADPLDGSSSRNAGQYEWSVSLAYRSNGKMRGGVIQAPRVLGGFRVHGSLEDGVYVEENGSKPRLARVSNKREFKKCMIYFGADTPQYEWLHELFGTAGRAARTPNINGSCALALAMVAAGKADALVQPVQSVWDYAAGWPLVELAGGKVQFMRVVRGVPTFIKGPEPEDYHPDERRLAFIAGSRYAVREIKKMIEALPRYRI